MRSLSSVLTALALAGSVLAQTAPAADAQALCNGVPVTIPGTDGDDVLDGTDGPDVIAGGAGSDRIRGLGGDDVLCGEGDDDRIQGGTGDDVIVGGDDRRGDEWGEGHFTYYGDLLLGGVGDDTFVGDGPDVTTDHPHGDDTVSYADAARPVRVRLDLGRARGQGHDTFVDTVTSVVLSEYDDGAVLGGDGAQVDGGAGDDVLGTAEGFRPPYNQTDADIDGYLDGGDGDDVVRSAGRGWRLLGGSGADHLDAGGRAVLVGGWGNDLIEGSGQADTIDVAGPGHDRVDARGGPDVLALGTSSRNLVERVVGNLGGGGDLVDVHVRPAAGTLIALGSGDDGVTWHPYAFDAEDAPLPDATFDGGPGRDHLDAPLLISDRTPGPIRGMRADLGAGTIRTLGTDALMAVPRFEDVTGSPWRDVLLGSAGPNRIFGWERDDVLRGRGGADVLRGDTGRDRAYGGAGDDRCDAEFTRSC